MSIRTEVITDKNRFHALAEQWRELRTGSEPLSPALSHAWFASWLDAFGTNVELHVVSIFQGDELQGVAPLCLKNGTFRGIPCRQLRFLYNRHGPRCGFLVRNGRSEYCKTLLAEVLRTKGWDLAVLENIAEESCLFDLAKPRSLSEEYLNLTRRTMSSPVLRMQGSWEQFFDTRPRNLRRSLRSKEKKLEAAGEVTIQHFTDSASAAGVMETLFNIGDRSWKASTGRAIGSDAGSKMFYGRLAETFGAAGELSIWLMRLRDEPVAFEFHLTKEKTVQALRAEFDEKYRDLGAGSVLDKEIIRRLFELGFTEYDMGGEADFYKLRWTEEVRRHSELLLFRKSCVGRTLHAVETAAVEPLKRLLGRGHSKEPRD